MPNTAEEIMEAKKVRDSRLDTLSIVVMFYTVITGVSFIFLNGQEIANQLTYERMTELTSIKVWGIIFIANAILHLIAVIVEYRRLQYIFFAIAGITGLVLFVLYTVASFDTTVYKINAFRYLLFAGINLTIALKGAIAWKQEKTLSQS